MSEENDTETTETAQTDPLHTHPRFREVNDQKRHYKRAHEEVSKERDALRAEVESLKVVASTVSELQARLAATESRWQEEASLMRVGLLDDDAREVARLLWSRLPEAERKPLPETVAAWKQAPESAPLALRGYLAPPAAPAPAPVGSRPTHSAQPPTPASKPSEQERNAAMQAFNRNRSPENKKRLEDVLARMR